MQQITSAHNPNIAWLRSLQKSAERGKQGLFTAEGIKEINFALRAGLKPRAIFANAQLDSQVLIERFPTSGQFRLPAQLFERVAYRGRVAASAVAVFEAPNLVLQNLKLGPEPFVIIVEAVEKPGNLGAILRVADGAGADAVIAADQTTDIYNPNVIRSSVGCVFTSQVVAADNQAVLDFCKINQLEIFAAALSDQAIDYTAADFSQACALVLGPESTGLSEFWLKNARSIKIPMLGKNDSLNVASAAAILAYEVVRQRNS